MAASMLSHVAIGERLECSTGRLFALLPLFLDRVDAGGDLLPMCIPPFARLFKGYIRIGSQRGARSFSRAWIAKPETPRFYIVGRDSQFEPNASQIGDLDPADGRSADRSNEGVCEYPFHERGSGETLGTRRGHKTRRLEAIKPARARTDDHRRPLIQLGQMNSPSFAEVRNYVTVNRMVAGSSPARGANDFKDLQQIRRLNL